jgi:predicted GNAT family acetyltransferase
MNWYYNQIIKESAMGDNSVEAFLARLGVPEETISYVTTITHPQLKQQAVGYLRQFPQTPSALLMEKIGPQNQQSKQPKRDPNTPQEIKLVNGFQNLEFQKWLLVFLRKARNNAVTKGYANADVGHYYLDPDNPITVHSIGDYAIRSQEIFDWYVRGVLPARQAMQAARTPEEQADVINEYGVTNANTNLAGLTFEQAAEFAKEWHEVISGNGEGLEYYGEKREDIVFGPKWSDPTSNGWTIKQVVTKNNLKAEGEKVGHCVGGYCDDVLKGNTRIFSLRDPSNVPYVTMEVLPGSWTFRQIYGNGPKTGNVDPSDKLKAMIGEWMRTLKGAAIEGAEDFDYNDLSYSDLDDDLESAIYKSAEGYGLPVSLINWDYKDAYEAVYHKLDNRSGGYDNNGGYQTGYVSKVLAKAAVESDLQKLNEGLINEKRMKAEALSLAYRSPKHYVYKKENFDRMTIENKKEYLKDYLLEATEKVNNEAQKAIKDKWYGWEKYTNPKNIEQQIIEKAYYNMSQAKEFDFSQLKSFDQLDEKNQIRFMSEAIDSQFQIAQIYDKKQENDEKFYDHYDDSYLEYPAEPDEDDFENPEEYQKDLLAWEEERERIQNEAADYHRNNSLPYCLDDSVTENIENILINTNMKLPKWFSKYFGKTKERTNYYPTLLYAFESVARKKKESLKKKPKRKASGWYNLCKFSESFLVQKTSDIYAITFDEAKRSDLIEDGNKFKSNGAYTFVDDSKMICRDEDYNMWVEDVSDFDKRYKIKDGKKKQIKSPSKEGFWQRYEPTEEATNMVEEVSGDEVLLKSNDDEWKITLKEYRKNYKMINEDKTLPNELPSKEANINPNISIDSDLHGISLKEDGDLIRIEAYDNERKLVIGYLNYYTKGNTLEIEMIEVGDKYKRHGIATQLINRMKQDHPGFKVEPGPVTHEGWPFFTALKKKRVI